MRFQVEFLSRDLPNQVFEADSRDALQQMYLDGKLDGDKINNAVDGEPELINITDVEETT